MSSGNDTGGKKAWIVVTTVNPPTPAINAISKLCSKGWSAVAVGDIKTPKDWTAPNITHLSVSHQKELFGEFADLMPYQHYCRKNLGYLFAISQGAQYILETDDDNLPYPSFGREISRSVSGHLIDAQGWVNIYKYFTEALIWPRGLPLDKIYSAPEIESEVNRFECPVQQYLADNDPDVDAIYRLINKDSVFFNQSSPPVILAAHSWAPFNSQNTLFFAEAFPLLYLPCHVSFRVTDIWRSFVAQEALWVHGYRVAFRASTIEQIRNPHDLVEDFNQEIVGYMNNRRIADLLDAAGAKLTDTERTSLSRTAEALWLALVETNIIPRQERLIIESWFRIIDKLTEDMIE